MPPADDGQRRNEMTASFETSDLQPPPPKRAKPNIPISVSKGLADLGNNADVLTEILLRLPGKSLIRFKSVHKDWHELISSVYFCRHHTLRHPKPQPSLILCSRRDSASSFYFDPSERLMIPYGIKAPHGKIVQECNGLMLLKSSEHRQSCYYVYNPTTRQSREISLTDSDEYPYVAAIGLAFDPRKTPQPHYKIVCIRSDSDPCSDSNLDPDSEPITYLVEIYGSESRTWKELSLPPFKRLTYSAGVYWNNSIYWGSCNGYGYFDITEDEMKTLSAPVTPDSPFPGITTIYGYLQESNGHLFHYEIILGVEFESVVVWELGGDDNSEWLLRHNHVVHPHPLAGSLDWPSCILRLMESEGKLSSLIYESETERIKDYNFLDKSYDDLVDITSQPFYPIGGSLKAHQFGESLALVHLG